MRKSIRVVLMLTAFAVLPLVHAGVIDRVDADAATGTWLAWGGQTRFQFNPDELARLGIGIDRADGASARTEGKPGVRYEVVAFPALDASALEINHAGVVISGIGGGSLRHAGGLVLRTPGGEIDLRGFALRASPDTRVGLDVVDAAGVVWFTADHAHYGFEDDARTVFSMRHMNLRLSAHFASTLGHPEWANDPVGGLDFRASAYASKSVVAPAGVCDAAWPDPPATTADVELIYGDFSGFGDDVYVKRCAGCTATSTTGQIVVNQDSSLRNAGSTAVAWYGKFTGNFPPYGNDQHPFLVWNLFRVGADGRIKQIGASGVKHAFYTVNYNCPCGGGNVLYPTCEDVYSSFNNDSSTDLGPRAEIIPFSAQWGRCGSVYDGNCDGIEDNGGGAQDLYEFRMNVVESELQPPLSDGARYFQEYWYIGRDDDAIYNSMGYREVAFHKTGSNWSVSLVGDIPAGADFHPGPTLDLWVDPNAPPANSANEELSTPLGRARVAVKAIAIGGGQWRYEYAVMNFDYAHARIDPAHPSEPNLMVDSTHGFSRFSVPFGAGVAISGLRFDDADLTAGNDWSVSTAANRVTWTAPAGSNSLDWGTLYHFEFVANAPPGAGGAIQLVGIATADEPELPYTLDIIVPQAAGDTIFQNGFD